MIVKTIDYKTAIDFLLPRHYSGRKPQIKYAFGWYDDNDALLAVCTFGKPASYTLCNGICGKEFSNNVYELNRLCREEVDMPPLSQFVSKCLRILKKYDLIIVSYSDTAMNHHGYIYQACNFIYTGMTKRRTDPCTPDGKHHRHYKDSEQIKYRKVRSAKYRYIYFCTYNKKLKKKWIESLNYKQQKYPKGNNNDDYVLGTFLKDEIIKK